jgi:tetratricopeptide (TPR) repeat protein
MKTFAYEGERYIWDGIRWLTAGYIEVPVIVAAQLNEHYAEMIEADDAAIADIQGLLDRAKMARDARLLTRAQRLVERVLAQKPHHTGAAAVLSSILREQFRPEEAIALADRFPDLRYAPLLTSRAAALCDLGRWAEALRDIRTALRFDREDGKQSSEETLSVFTRIRAAAPHLLNG